MAKYKVVHYINQFYAGMGGEDTASVGISVRDGAVGPGLALKANLGADYEIVKTIICGDNTIAEKTAEIVPQIVELVKEAGADLFLAGPGFNAGRYGIGCGATTAAVTEQLLFLLRIPELTSIKIAAIFSRPRTAQRTCARRQHLWQLLQRDWLRATL